MSVKTTIQEEEVNEAIQEEDAEETEPKDVEKPVLARDKMIEEIAAKRKQELSQTEQQQEQEEEEEETDESDSIVDLKVDGTVVQMPKSEVDAKGGIAEVQKTLTAEKRLHEASIAKKQMEQAQAEYRRKEQELKKREQELEAKLRASQAPKVPDVDMDSAADEFIKHVYSGDEDEAKQSLNKILKSLKQTQAKPTQQINESDILNKALFEVEKRNGQREFQEKFPHLMKDKFLYDKTNYETIQIMNANPNMSPRDIILEAARKVDQEYRSLVKEKGADTLQQRSQAKQKIDPIKPAQARKKTDNDYKPKSRDEIMDMYRKTRAK